MKFRKERRFIFGVDTDMHVPVVVTVLRGENGELTISTKIGDEPAIHRETSIYNPNVVKNNSDTIQEYMSIINVTV